MLAWFAPMLEDVDVPEDTLVSDKEEGIWGGITTNIQRVALIIIKITDI